MATGKSIKTPCQQCREHTNHSVVCRKRVVRMYQVIDNSENPGKERNIDDYMMVQCKGCNSISFVIRHSGDSFTDENGKRDYIDMTYPENPLSDDESNLLSYEDRDYLPRKLYDLYEEVSLVFKEEANMLAGVGLRMLVEAICLEQKITGSNLKVKIQALQNKGLISTNEVPILDILREIGNHSAHGIKSFSIDKLGYALDIINHVLKSIYVLPRIRKKLKL